MNPSVTQTTCLHPKPKSRRDARVTETPTQPASPRQRPSAVDCMSLHPRSHRLRRFASVSQVMGKPLVPENLTVRYVLMSTALFAKRRKSQFRFSEV